MLRCLSKRPFAFILRSPVQSKLRLGFREVVAIPFFSIAIFSLATFFNVHAIDHQTTHFRPENVMSVCPSTIAFGETASCAIDLPAETDSYTFAAHQGDKILIRMSNTDTLWSGVAVYDADGNALEGCEARHPTTAEIASCELPHEGAYRLWVYDGYNGSLTGDYHLYVQRLNNPGHALSLAEGQIVTGAINSPAQMDVYTFTARAGSRVLIKMSNTAQLWSGIRVYGVDGALLPDCEATHPTTAEIASCELPAEGAYRILAYDGYNGTLTGGYHLIRICLNPSCQPDAPTETPTPTDTPPVTLTPTSTSTHTPTLTPTLTPTPTETAVYQDDLFGYPYELWTDPVTLRAQVNNRIGLLVHRQGGKQPLSNVVVRFYLGDPTTDGVMLGDGAVPLLSPRGVENTSTVTWQPVAAGNYDIYAIIDPEDAILESLEQNNVISRTVTALPPPASNDDLIAPHVDSFTINLGNTATISSAVQLDTVASDPSPGRGVASLFFLEYEYNQAANQWSPAHESGWVDYTDAQTDYAWQLLPSVGVKYLQAWAIDHAGNISYAPFKAHINYMPQVDEVNQDQTRVYRYDLRAGEALTAQVDPVYGDPDLYIWAPDSATRPPWVHNLSEGVDEISLVAPISGTYQIEVYGYTAAGYRLAVSIAPAGVVAAQNENRLYQNKPVRTQPAIPLTSQPGIYTPPLPLTPVTESVVYLPLIQR